jgi:multidrug efflux pump subunit AcrA (membrane-fusion protein)
LNGRPGFSGLWLAVSFLGMPMLVWVGVQRRKAVILLAMGVIALMSVTWTGCGGGGGNGGTTPPPNTQTVTTSPGTYTLNVTATAGSISSSQQLTLIVQ